MYISLWEHSITGYSHPLDLWSFQSVEHFRKLESRYNKCIRKFRTEISGVLYANIYLDYPINYPFEEYDVSIHLVVSIRLPCHFFVGLSVLTKLSSRFSRKPNHWARFGSLIFLCQAERFRCLRLFDKHITLTRYAYYLNAQWCDSDWMNLAVASYASLTLVGAWLHNTCH